MKTWPPTTCRGQGELGEDRQDGVAGGVVVRDGAIAETLGPARTCVVVAEHGEHVAHEEDPQAIDMSVKVIAGRRRDG